MKIRHFIVIILLLGITYGMLSHHVLVSSQFHGLLLLTRKDGMTFKNTVVFLDRKFKKGSNSLSSLLLGLDWMRKNPEIYSLALKNGWKPEVAAGTAVDS